jgi:septum formation protein
MLQPKRMILASASPRRKELLSAIVPNFDIISPKVEEIYPPHISGKAIPEYLSLLKINAVKPQVSPETFILCADTVVLLEGEVLEKPKHREEAISMLHKLSGKHHEVVTAIAWSYHGKEEVFSDSARVHFNVLSSAEIEYYVDTFHPLDKAGSYGIQDWIGQIAISRIEGSFYTVMGLPLHLVYAVLKKELGTP